MKVFRVFSQLYGKFQGILRKDGARSALFLIFVLFNILFVLCRSVYFLSVNVYCITATGWLPNCSLQIYHIIYHMSHCDVEGKGKSPHYDLKTATKKKSYIICHILTYHIMSYLIIYHVISYIISYHISIISYHIIYHII
jgi:hypothetical protein